MTYTYNRKGITRKVLSEIVRGLGAKDELKILKWQIRIIIVYFRFRPCVNRKIVATRKCSWHVCASCHYDVSSFPTYLQSNRTPCPRKSLGWGVVAGSCWIVLKTAVKRDAVLCGATCRKIFVFPTYESVACSITTQLLTLT